MGTRRIILSLALLLAVLRPSAAQEVVVDPTHIGVAVENTAASLQEMITMIEEMFSLNDKVDDLYGLAEKVDEVADRFRQVGYLIDMTETYNYLLERTVAYSDQIKEWADEGIYGYEKEMRYLYRCEKNGIRLFNQYMDFFKTLRTSDADKVNAAKTAMREMEAEVRHMDTMMENAFQSREIGKTVNVTIDFFDRYNRAGDYIGTYRHLGSADRAADSWINLIRLLQTILLGFMSLMAIVLIMRGQDLGTNVSSMTPVRLLIAGGVSYLVLDVLEKVIR